MKTDVITIKWEKNSNLLLYLNLKRDFTTNKRSETKKIKVNHVHKLLIIKYNL